MLPAVVDNLPQVPEEKVEKLLVVVKKIFGQIGTIRDGVRLHTLLANKHIATSLAACAVCTYLKCAICSGLPSMFAGGVWMPQDEETKATKGFAFIEYSSPAVR